MRIEFDERESAMKNVDKLPVKATLDAKINWAATRDTPEVAALRGPTNMPRLLAEYMASVYAAEKGLRCDVIAMRFQRLTWGASILFVDVIAFSGWILFVLAWILLWCVWLLMCLTILWFQYQ